MYAIVKAGGKQYRVQEGDSLLVDRMHAEEGSTVTLQPLLLRGDGADGQTVFEGPELEKVRVEAVVTGHERGKKLHVLKFKPKVGYKRRMGHRADLTRLEIREITTGAGRSSARSGSQRKRAARGASQGEGGEASAKKKEEEGDGS